LKVRNPFLMECVNYSDGGYNEGNEAFESVEYIWDVLLTDGKTVYGTMSDDTHVYAEEKDWYKNAFSETSNHFIQYVYKSFMKCHTPGNGFVMVNADLNENSIKNALRRGDFYASNGLLADCYEVTDKGIKVKIQKQNNENNRIIFKGRMGLPLKIVDGDEAEYEFTGSFDEQYVRVKAINGAYKTILFQPIFRDGRNKIIE
ncbi:MAG: hypothetical protein KBT47_02330, partial [Armatimonadetes bacterium]|nr:hypothetical protein [Candidatus Hippobium faecium]